MSAKKNYMRVFCPHCNGEINVSLEANAISKRRMGPKPYDPGPEIDAFVINAVENRKLSFRTIGDLLGEKGLPTAKGGARWYATSVRTLYENALIRREANSREIHAV
jgi:hypothetical protein